MFENVFSLWLLLGKDIIISTSENHRKHRLADIFCRKMAMELYPGFSNGRTKAFYIFPFSFDVNYISSNIIKIKRE